MHWGLYRFKHHSKDKTSEPPEFQLTAPAARTQAGEILKKLGVVHFRCLTLLWLCTLSSFGAYR